MMKLKLKMGIAKIEYTRRERDYRRIMLIGNNTYLPMINQISILGTVWVKFCPTGTIWSD